MSTNGATREQLLERYGRWYGDQHFAIAFTQSTTGDPEAKQCTTKAWQTTTPLAGADYAAGLIGNRGKTRNPVIVLRQSNLIGLECDTEEDLVRIDQLGLPETITVRTSADYKRHFWFRPPAEIETLPYVAFRFESGKLTADSGRYFLVPPAIHPSGQVYTFLPGRGPDTQIAEMPAAIYRQLAAQARVEDADQREQIRLDPDAKIHAGNRRDMLFRYACMLRRWGLTRPEIAAQVHAYNEARCIPVVERSLVEIQIDGAMKKHGGQELQNAGANPLPDEPATQTEEQPTEQPTDPWTPRNLADLPDHPPVQPDLARVGVGLVYPGKRHVFSGPQESAKTLAAYALGIQIARDGGTVLIIDFEMGAWDARNRLRELGASRDEITRMPYIEPHEPAQPNTMQLLLAVQPRLVIVDAAAGAYDLQGLDDNKRGDVERLTRLYIHTFWRNGVATIMLDHVVKNTETRGKYAIGSERKVGGADVHLGFETISPIQRGKHGLYKIVTHKDRGGYLQRGNLANLELASDPVTHHITWTFKPTNHEPEDKPQLPTILMERASKTLEEAVEPLTQNQIVRNTKGNETYLAKAVDYLVDLGYAAETDGPRAARVFSSITAFRKDEYEVQHANTTTSANLRQPPPDLRQTEVPSPPPTSAFPLKGEAGGGGGGGGSQTSDLRQTDDEYAAYLDQLASSRPDHTGDPWYR